MERVFRFGSPASCLTSFRYGDADYQPGDAFPYQRLGVERHQALGLWFNGLIDFGEPAKHGTMQTATVASGDAVTAKSKHHKRRW